MNAMDLYVWGADGTWEEVPGESQYNGLSAEDYSELVPASFHMTGGVIANNSAPRTGGGVNVISNAVKLEGGTIRDNTAAQQGGGVYVATATYTLQLRDTVIYENTRYPCRRRPLGVSYGLHRAQRESGRCCLREHRSRFRQ